MALVEISRGDALKALANGAMIETWAQAANEWRPMRWTDAGPQYLGDRAGDHWYMDGWNQDYRLAQTSPP